MNFVQVISVLLIVTVILFQKIDILISKSSVLTFKINFTLLSITLTDDGKKTKSLSKLKNALKSISPLYSGTKYLIKNSDIAFCYLPADTSKPVVISAAYFAFIAAIQSFMTKNARSFSAIEPGAAYSAFSEKSKISFYAKFHFRLIHLFISLFIFLYYKIKYMIKRLIKNV